MKTSIKNQEKELLKLMAKEFLENRLGIAATYDNVSCLVKHLIQFKKEAKQIALKKSTLKQNSNAMFG